MSYQVKLGISTSKGVCINRRKSQKFGSAWALPPCSRGMTDSLEICFSPMCYSAKFCRSRSNGMGVIKEIHLKI